MHHLDAQLWRNWQSTSERFRVARAALGHLVHDFRNGLSGVVGYVELLKHLLQAGSKELAFVEKMDLAASQALRDFSELSQSSDPQPHSPTTVDLAALAGEMVGAKQIVSSVPIQLQSNGAVRSGAGLNLRLVTGERVRLLAACGELLTNAIEAVSNAGPPILVSLRSFAPSELPEELGARLSRAEVEASPLYELIGIPLGGATQTIGAAAADEDDAALLDIPVGSPVLVCARVTRSADGRPVLMSEHVFPAHLTEFSVELPSVDASMAPSGLRLVE